MTFHAYLFFSGNCREAFSRYHEIFGGELTLLPMSEVPASEPGADALPPGSEGMIMHAALKIGDDMLMASDDPTGDGGPKTGVAVSYTAPDAGEAKRVFDALSDGGEVTMALSETFFSPAFGTCTDRFGVPWMVNTDAQQG
jgi:PhnB protein